MMKKYIILCTVLGAAAVLGGLTACKDGEEPSGSATAQTVCEKLNGFVKKDFTKATLDISVSKGGETLKSNYSLVSADGGYTVTYQYEQINPITETGGVYTVPSEYKKTYSGSMQIKDGEVVSHTGDPTAQIPATDKLTASGVKFDPTYFEDFAFDDGKGTVTAKVKSPAEFLSQEGFTGTGMTLSVGYGTESITSMKIEYASANSYQVLISYQFG